MDTSADPDVNARTFTPAMQVTQAPHAKLVLGLRLRLRSHLEICEASQTQAQGVRKEKEIFHLLRLRQVTGTVVLSLLRLLLRLRSRRKCEHALNIRRKLKRV